MARRDGLQVDTDPTTEEMWFLVILPPIVGTVLLVGVVIVVLGIAGMAR